LPSRNTFSERKTPSSFERTIRIKTELKDYTHFTGTALQPLFKKRPLCRSLFSTSFTTGGAAYQTGMQRSLLAKEELCGILLAISQFPKELGSFTCPKAGTWDRLFFFPSEGRHAVDFSNRKNLTASVGSEPAILGTRGQNANH
jgi:hypothetical protein